MASAHDIVQTAIQETNGDVLESGAYCTGYIVIAEWMSPDGARWLSHMAGSPSGPGLPQWQARGYLHEALFHPAQSEDEEDDEDEV